MKSRQDELRHAVRLGVRRIRVADIEGDPGTVLIEQLQIIKAAVEFMVRDVTPEELRVAIIETFNEIDSERNVLELIARFCEGRLEGMERLASS